MASTQKATVFQVYKTNKNGSKVAVSSHRGAEVTTSTPQRTHGYYSSSQRAAAVSLSSPPPLPSPPPPPPPPSQKRAEAASTTHHSTSDYPRSVCPQSGPGLSAVSTSRGTETRPRHHSPHHSPHQKNQSVQTLSSHLAGVNRNVSPVREESTRRTENKPGREVGYHSSMASDAKYRHLYFTREKEEDPPSKVQNPQGVKVPRRVSAYPKDEAIQTEPTRRTTAEVKSSRNVSVQEHSSRTANTPQIVIRKIPPQEPEVGHSSVLSEPKTSQKTTKLSTGLKLSVLRDLDGAPRAPPPPLPPPPPPPPPPLPPPRPERSFCIETKPPKILISETEPTVRSPPREREVGRKVTISPGKQSMQSPHRVTCRTVSEGTYKSPLYSELSPKPSTQATSAFELTPRPLPPRSLPKYGPDCSWWALLNPKVETPQNQSIFDFEPKSPPFLEPLESFYEMDSTSFCEDLMFQRDKASLPPSPKESLYRVPLTEVQKTLKYTSKQPSQGFNAFFLGM